MSACGVSSVATLSGIASALTDAGSPLGSRDVLIELSKVKAFKRLPITSYDTHTAHRL